MPEQREPITIPHDPHSALLALQEADAGVPLIFVATAEEAAALDAVRDRIAAEHTGLLDRLGFHRGRAVAGVFAVLRNCVITDGQPVTANQEQTIRYMLPYLDIIAAGATAKLDPLHELFNPNTHQKNPALRPPLDLTLRPTPALRAAERYVAQEPSRLISGLQTAVRQQHIVLEGAVRLAHDPILQATITELVGRGLTKAQSCPVAQDFTKAFARHMRLRTGTNSPLTFKHIRPHLDAYLEQAQTLDQMHFAHPYQRALTHSPEAIDNLYETWVRQKGIAPWVFHAIVGSPSLDIQARLKSMRPNHEPRADELRSAGPLRFDATVEARAKRAQTNYRDLDELQLKIRYPDAMALAVAYDLDINGAETVNVPRVVSHLGIKVTSLAQRTRRHTLPQV